ncbi:MAG: BatD family protein [Opitutaceae bacterium]
MKLQSILSVKQTFLSVLPCAILILLATHAAQAEITVSTSFQPARIALGDTAQYIVAIAETSSSEKPTPERMTSLPISQSGGLTLRNGRVTNSQQSRIVNTSVTHTVTQNLIIEATAPRVGNFTIPSYRFTYKGETYTAPAATLTVVERDANAPPPVNELIFLKAAAPEQLYIGQTTPIQLKLYVHEQVRYRGYESFDRNADGFTVSELPDATQSTERVNNNRYQVINWPITITPIQSGKQSLNFEFSVVAQLPAQNQNRNNGFGSSVFDNFFNNRSERFNLYTDPTEIEVLPLPETDKPDSFSGAIGNFSIQVYADTETSRVGEPIMLSLKVSGRGNFDRITGPELPESSDWRHYTPEAIMEKEDPLQLKGVKRFDYVFIPEKAGKRMLPEVKFSYFDPIDKKYIELSVPPIAIEVAPSLQPQLPAPAQTAGSNSQASDASTPLQPTLSPEEALLTLDYRPETPRTTGFALLKAPRFYLANGSALIALIICGAILRKSKRLATDPEYAQQQAAKAELKATLGEAKHAESQGNAADFYRHAQDAVRLAATKRYRQNLRAAELAQLEPLLPEAIAPLTRQIFEQADALRFSGQTQQADLRTARQQLDTILKAL